MVTTFGFMPSYATHGATQASRPPIESAMRLWLPVAGRQRWWLAACIRSLGLHRPAEQTELEATTSGREGNDACTHLYSAPRWMLPKRQGLGSFACLQLSSDAATTYSVTRALVLRTLARAPRGPSYDHAAVRAPGGGCGAAAVCVPTARLGYSSVTAACCLRHGWAGGRRRRVMCGWCRGWARRDTMLRKSKLHRAIDR